MDLFDYISSTVMFLLAISCFLTDDKLMGSTFLILGFLQIRSVLSQINQKKMIENQKKILKKLEDK